MGAHKHKSDGVTFLLEIIAILLTYWLFQRVTDIQGRAECVYLIWLHGGVKFNPLRWDRLNQKSCIL